MASVLDPIVIVSPVVTGALLSVDAEVIPVVVKAPLGCDYVQATLGHTTVTSTHGDITPAGDSRIFTVNVPTSDPGDEIILFGGNDQAKTPTATIRVLISPTTAVLPPVNPPSGVTVHRGRNTCKVEWATPVDEGFLGVRVQTSIDSSGIMVPYKQYGDLVSRISRTGASTVTIDQDVQEDSSHTSRITTTREAIVQVNYSSVEITPQDGGAEEFFVILSTVVFDPKTNSIYESVFNGPFRCSTVDLRRATPTDFPYLQTREDIAGRMISEITRDYPNLDLTPRSETRDTSIDPLSLELSEGSIRQWFSRCSHSVSAMCVIDDSDGDGISDPVTTNQLKQQLARAWYLNGSEMQALIDKQFDLLGERAGLTRGGSNPAITNVTIYTYTKPTSKETVEAGSVVATIPDSETPSVQFTTLTTGVFDPNSVDSYYDPENGWWSIEVPARCNQSGTIGNIGAKTLRQPVSGIPAGYSVTNLSAADYGQNIEPNIRYAERIQTRLVAGVDTGTRRGYLGTARAVPGVTDAQVVASGDLEMLRDWDHNQRKHIFGTVDIYVRGNTAGQQETQLPHLYPVVERTLSFNKSSNNFNYIAAGMPAPMCVLELTVSNAAGAIYLGCDNAVIDNNRGVVYPDLKESPYVYQVTDNNEVTRKRVPHPTFTTNAQALAAMTSQYTFKAQFRVLSPLATTPAYQPVVSVASVTSRNGAIPMSSIRLVKTQDPLLLGGSNKSDDKVEIDISASSVVEKEMFFIDGGSNVKPLDVGMFLDATPDGKPTNVLSVRSLDKTKLYQFGKDYIIVPNKAVGGYSLQRTEMSEIPLRDPQASIGGEILIAYYKLRAPEVVTQATENLTLKGTSFSTLSNSGIVQDPRVLLQYGLDTIEKALVGKSVWGNRYILVKYQGNPMLLGRDFVVDISPIGSCQVARVIGGSIPDDATVEITYAFSNVFTVKTTYPVAVQQVSTAVEKTRHAAADVVVKAMQENAVDVSLTVELDPNASPEIVDPQIRTILTLVMDQAREKLSQSEVIRQIKSLPGVSSIHVPLSRFAKSDGSYDIGHLIQAGTPWSSISSDPRMQGMTFPDKTFITTNRVLPNMTRPSGGLQDSYVGLLYEGFSFKRLFSLREFASTGVPSFYIIGYNDTINGVTPFDQTDVGKVVLNLPNTKTDADIRMSKPDLFPFRVTYQIWYEAGYRDILISPSEFLRPGKIAIDYVLPKKGSVLQ